MAKNNSRLTYIAPKEQFVMVSNEIITKFDPFVIGVYCKLIKLSSGKSLDMEFISKKIDVSQKRLRKVIVFLEDNGYITRMPLKTEDGKFSGWNYQLYAEPVSNKLKTHAGKAKETENGLDQKRTSPQTDKSKNGKDNIISNNDIIYNIDEEFKDKEDKESTVVDKKPTELSLFGQSEEEQKFIAYMRENFPRIMKMQKPLTLEEAKQLKKDYGEDLLYQIMQDADNYKPLLKNYVSANLVLRKWCSKERAKS